MSYIGNTPTEQAFVSETQQFSGDGSTVNFTLTRAIYSIKDIEVVVNGVVQNPFDAFTVSGTTLTFTEAPSSGTNNITVVYRNYVVSRFIPDDGSVTGSMLAANTVGSSNLTTTGVTSGSYGGASNVTTITVDAQGRILYAANVAIETGFNPFLLSGM